MTVDWGERLALAIERSDVKIVAQLKQKGPPAKEAWRVHLALFPAVQRVLNPPFINPHLPKMYGVCRDLMPYLEPADIPGMLYMEVAEYTRRSKIERLAPKAVTRSRVSFDDIKGAIRNRESEASALLLSAFLRQEGGKELARRLILLGSGYLTGSLGHSVSCTAFIVRELLQQPDQDPWPTMTILADYFCKGQFDTTPPLRRPGAPPDSLSAHRVLSATTGSSFVDIHHTITLYAIERSRHLFDKEEYDHLIESWVAYMGEKQPGSEAVDGVKPVATTDYAAFFRAFSALDSKAVLSMALPMLGSDAGRTQLGRSLVRGLCDLYQGDYNPHYVTGLGALLWVLENYRTVRSIASNALCQYLNFLFRGLRSNA